MAQHNCPRPEELSGYAYGGLPEERADDVAAHVETCPACEQTVQNLEAAEDTLLNWLRGPASPEDPYDAEEPCRRVVDVVVAFRQGEQSSDRSTPAVSSPEPPVERIRSYRLLEKLGQGGMGAVYRALHTELGKAVALKLLPPDHLRNPQAVARFRREMRAIGRVEHPNIVRALDAGEDDGRHYLAMELVQGCDLARLLEQTGPLPPAEACELIRQAALGLQCAHEHGLVHRDLKPSNLMLGRDGVVKILDLGLARLADPMAEPGSEVTAAGEVMGTLDYMAPEQGVDTRSVDVRADIYSLGATLYKLLTGRAPFAGPRYDTTIAKLLAIAQEVPQAVTELSADVPAGLNAVVLRMLAKRPEDRYASPQEVAQALTPFAEGAAVGRLLERQPLDGRSLASNTTKWIAAKNGAAAAGGESKSDVVRNSIAPQDAAGQGARRSGWRGWTAALLGGIALLAAVVITVQTPEGQIAVQLAPGVSPEDVTVEVRGDGGTRVADSSQGWSIDIAEGRYRVELGAGSERFQLDKHRVEVRRDDAVIVTVSLDPENSRAAARAAPSAKGSAASVRRVAPTVPERPWVQVRNGADVRAFKSLAGALAEAQPDDAIEVRSDGPVTLEVQGPLTKPLRVHAGAGFRPTLVLRQPIDVQGQPLELVGCDIDMRGAQVRFRGSGNWDFRHCRIWCYSLADLAQGQILMQNCLYLGSSGVILHPGTTLEVQDSVIRFFHEFVNAEAAAGQVVRLRENTFYSVHGGAPALLAVTPGDKPVRIESEGNLFVTQSQAHQPIRIPVEGEFDVAAWTQDLKRCVEWQGRDNAYSRGWYEIWAPSDDGGWEHTGGGVEAWAELWGDAEQGAVDAGGIDQFALNHARRFEPAERQALAAELDDIRRQTGLADVGPEWDLLGPGEAYVRSLRREGRLTDDADLRPEVHPEGPIVLLREGRDVRGFTSLAAAMDAARDGDVLELRTDGHVGGGIFEGPGRRITIRAAAGYSPVLSAIHERGRDRYVLEGLTFEDHFTCIPWNHNPGRGAVIRAANCDFGESLWLRADGDECPAAEIVNCTGAYLGWLNEDPAELTVRNSLFRRIAHHSDAPAGHRLVLDRCALRQIVAEYFNDGLAPLNMITNVHAANTLFQSPEALLVGPLSELAYSGEGNVYQIPATFVAGAAVLDLADWRRRTDSDESSVELWPAQMDPEVWRLKSQLPARGDGRPYGANVDAILELPASDDAGSTPQPAPKSS